MKRALFLLLLSAAVVAVVGMVLAQQATPPDADELQKLVDEFRAEGQPDTSSKNWRRISDDVGLVVYTDRYGMHRATVFVKAGDRWQSVAVDGLRELAPEALPLR